MARRSSHSREELAALVVTAARELVESEGSQGLTMRGIAAKIGYSAGSIYNAVGDQELVRRRVDADVLTGLVACLEAVPRSEAAMERAERIAETYVDYVLGHARLWAALLEHPPLPGDPVPDFYAGPRARLIEIVAETIQPFFTDPAELRLAVIALWSALQGVAALAVGGNLHFLAGEAAPKEIARSIVRRYLTSKS